MVIDFARNSCYFQFCKSVKINLAENLLKRVNVINTSDSSLNVGCVEMKES